MSYFLFFIYIPAACWWLFRSSLLRATGLPVFYWIYFFILKTAAGCYYGYWYAKPANIASADTWHFHFAGLQQYHLLFSKPAQYFSGFFSNGYNNLNGYFSPTGYWNDLKDHLMEMIFSVMDIFSGGHYYVNVVIYSFITFFGFVYCCLACKNVLHKTPSLFTVSILLLTPSCLFWTSGLHRDGLVLLFISLCCWSGTCIAKRPKRLLKYLVVLLISFLALLALRNYVAVLFIFPFLAWLAAARYRLKNNIVFPVAALLCTALFFCSSLMHTAVDLPARLVERKISFDQLTGNSRMPDMILEPGFQSFARNLPLAIDRSFFQPRLWNAKKSMELIAAAELILAIAAMLYFTFFGRRRYIAGEALSGFQWMLVFFCTSNMLVIGYVVPFAGAVVRYRAIFLMLLLLAASLGAANKNKTAV